MSLEDVALRSALLWLLLPAVGLPVCLLVGRNGHGGLLPRLVVWLLVIPVFLGASYLGTGTSYASAFITGQAAAYLSAPEASPEAVDLLLRERYGLRAKPQDTPRAISR